MVAIDGGMHRTRLEEVSLGMVVLGLIFSSMLYGIMLTQTYKYFQRFRRDPPLVKLLVFAVWLLNTVSVFFVAHASWYYLVTTGPRGLSIWSLNVELALSMAMSGISETFLAARVYKLSGRKIWLTGILLMLALLHFGSGEVAAVEFLLLKRFAKFGSVKVPSIIRLSSAAVTDTAIAVSLCYFLQKKRTGFKKDDEVVNYLILFSINSGLLTSLISIASLATYLLVPRTWVYTALCFLLSRLYANTFLCSLNSRQILLSSGSDNEKHLPKGARFRPRRSTWSVAGDKSPTQIDVFVVTETITDGPQILTSAKVNTGIPLFQGVFRSV
ncbi:hypothetical protein B0H34DRAFT_481954 [Crassisporium funariophilum]|nr:hypothetical protein B0H34DRAFT_481954 [Crassisporium funariophilum]